MSDTMLPLVYKAPVEGLQLQVSRSGLAPGDTAWLQRLRDGRIGVIALVRQPFLKVIPRRQAALLGHLGTLAEEIVAPSLDHGDTLRVRIVALVPEYLTNGAPPEVHVSVWGDPKHLFPVVPFYDPPEPPANLTGRLSWLEVN